MPDLIDFFIGKCILAPNVSFDSCHDLSSDHSPIILHLERDIKRSLPPCHLCNSKTDWALLQNLLEYTIDIKLSLKTEDDITKAVKHFNTSVQNAAWTFTPQICINNSPLHNVPKNISELITANRKARKMATK